MIINVGIIGVGGVTVKGIQEIFQISAGAEMFNTSIVAVNNSLWQAQYSSFKLPYKCEILKMEVCLGEIDSGTAGQINAKINGKASNIFTQNLVLNASSENGTNGVSINTVTADNKGEQGDLVLFETIAGQNANAHGGMVFFTLKRL